MLLQLRVDYFICGQSMIGRLAHAFRLLIIFHRELNDERQAGEGNLERSSFRRNNSSQSVFRQITYEYQVCQSIDVAALCLEY